MLDSKISKYLNGGERMDEAKDLDSLQKLVNTKGVELNKSDMKWVFSRMKELPDTISNIKNAENVEDLLDSIKVMKNSLDFVIGSVGDMIEKKAKKKK